MAVKTLMQARREALQTAAALTVESAEPFTLPANANETGMASEMVKDAVAAVEAKASPVLIERAGVGTYVYTPWGTLAVPPGTVVVKLGKQQFALTEEVLEALKA